MLQDESIGITFILQRFLTVFLMKIDVLGIWNFALYRKYFHTNPGAGF